MSDHQTPAKTPSGQAAQRDPFTSLSDRLDRIFGEMTGFPGLGRGFPTAPRFANLASRFDFKEPRVNVAESEKSYEITAELPGIDEKDVEVSVANGVLTLKGEKNIAKEEKDESKNYHLVERSHGSFQRSFGVPEDVDQNAIDAHFTKGVLTITLPKVAPRDPEADQKKIKITSR